MIDSLENELGFFSVNAKGTVRSWDNNMSAMLGYASSEIVGQSMELLIPKSYRERHWRGFLEAMSRGATKHDQPALNVPFRHKDGHLALHPAREILLRNAFGSPVGVVAIVSSACVLGEENGLPSPYSDAFELADQ